MSRDVYLPRTGDIILSNTYTVLSRLATGVFGTPYGHVGVCVRIDDTPLLYSISLEQPKPSLISLGDYLAQPVVMAATVRELRVPLNREEEDKFKKILIKYEYVSHNSFHTRLHDMRDGHVGTNFTGMGDTAFVQAILQDMGMMEQSASTVVSTAFFMPSSRRDRLDSYYKDTLSPLISKNYTVEQAKTILAKQVGLLVDLLI